MPTNDEIYRSEIERLLRAGVVFAPTMSILGLTTIMSALQMARYATPTSENFRQNLEHVGRILASMLADHSQELAAIIDQGWVKDAPIMAVKLKQ